MVRILLILSTLTYTLSSCKHLEPLSQGPVPTLITGLIDQPVKADIILPAVAYPANLTGLGKLGDTSSVHMVAYGGSIMAGFRDGGLFREGQLLAFPNLIAHQMGLVSFVSPLFSSIEGNGTGYMIYDKTDSLPSWKLVTNKLGVVSSNPYILTKYSGPAPDNLGLPHGIRPGAADSTIYRYFYPTQKQYFTFLNRLFSATDEGKYPITYFLDTRKVDLILYERDLDQWIGIATYPENVTQQADIAFGGGTMYYVYEKFIIDNLQLGRKLVLFNQPDYLDFPFFHLFDIKKLKGLNNTTGIALEDSALLIPSNKIKLAFAQKGSGSLVLEDRDVLSMEEVNRLKGITRVNNQYAMPDLAKNYNLPVVDLYTVYKKVLNRQYITAEGFFIDPTFPSGNFFSNDGLYPSAIGHAVIANETILVINKVYKTNIPLINIRQLAMQL